MRQETRLDSVTFQLTPTRTRCDLVINANGEKEKVASGLLGPFISHLKAAQNQIERGGYSIVLEPNQENRPTASWFTKGTVEKFVRFVSTPEVLERVNTIESEIVQIDEAISIQHNNIAGLSIVDGQQIKPPESKEGSLKHLYLSCDLVINANGEKEKVASGLLGPFISHLKAAQNQIERGGYSIVLEPNQENRPTASWFTKGTVEKFVRFVSTPEVLERVNTIESEIVQIDEAISIQHNNIAGLSIVDGQQIKPPESKEGNRSISEAEAEKAIILYKPGNQQDQPNGSSTQENSRVMLLRVLESRKTVLQKEQGMAFARAVAADFNVEHMDDLISFAECFGAARLREACQAFVELWKRKHETAHWVEAMEMQAAEGIPSQTELQIPWSVAHGDVCLENRVKTQAEQTNNCEHVIDPAGDKRSPSDQQVPSFQNNYFQGQAQHPMYMQWPPQGAPIFPAYPLPGIPYYASYPGSGPFFQQPYAQADNPNSVPSERIVHKKNSMDVKDDDVDSDSFTENSEIDKEEEHRHASRRKGGRGSKKHSGTVVIRNINYITSKRKNDGESQSGSGSETEEEIDEVPRSSQKTNHKGSARSSREKVKHLLPVDDFGSYEKKVSKGTEVENGQWSAFQNFLLSKDDDGADKDMFPLDNSTHVRRRETASAADSFLPDGSLGPGTSASHRITEHDISNSKLIQKGRSDESTNTFPYNKELSNQQDIQFSETESRFRGHKRMGEDDFMMYGHQNQASAGRLRSDPIAASEFEGAGSADQISCQGPIDESFIVPVRSSSQTSADGEMATLMDKEFLNTKTITDSNNQRLGNVICYEPDDLSMMPDRGIESSYDVVVDYEMQIQADMSFPANGVNLTQKLQDEGQTVDEQEKRTFDRDKKTKLMRETMEKRKVDAARNTKFAKSSPLAEAQARAGRIRAYKADLQKAKIEQEDEKIKRLEALKKEREKRIAARSSAMQSPSPSQQIKSQLSTKISPSLLKYSKFTDSGSASPATKIGSRSGSVCSLSSVKTLRSDTSSDARVVQNGLTRSASSLQDHKKENANTSVSSRLRKLSEPKSFNSRFSDQKQTPKQRETVTQGTKISPSSKTNRSASAVVNRIISAGSSPGPVHNKVNTRETKHRAPENQSSSGSGIRKKNIRHSSMSHGETSDTVVIDKNILTIEHDMPVAPTVQASEENKELRLHDHYTAEYMTASLSEYATIRAPPSVLMDDVGMNGQAKQVKPFDFQEAVQVDCVAEEITLNLPKASMNEQPYNAPRARKSSLEEVCASNSEYSKALPLPSESFAPLESSKAHVPESSSQIPSQQIFSGPEKHLEKESKGLKRLLKFGRKNNGSSSSEKEKGPQKVDIADPKADSGYEVPSLKNLIAQDDGSPDGGTNQKGSRSYSLLSHFRSKKPS